MKALMNSLTESELTELGIIFKNYIYDITNRKGEYSVVSVTNGMLALSSMGYILNYKFNS